MKICIVGPSGAGKTTITKKLADELKISTYGFDEIYWNISGTEFVKNSKETISQGIKEIILQDSWIVEGAYDKRLLPLLLECSLILKNGSSFLFKNNKAFTTLFKVYSYTQETQRNSKKYIRVDSVFT